MDQSRINIVQTLSNEDRVYSTPVDAGVWQTLPESNTHQIQARIYIIYLIWKKTMHSLFSGAHCVMAHLA